MIDFLLTTGRPENQVLDDYIRKYEDIARAKTHSEDMHAVASKLLEKGVDLNIISQSTGIPIEELKK